MLGGHAYGLPCQRKSWTVLIALIAKSTDTFGHNEMNIFEIGFTCFSWSFAPEWGTNARPKVPEMSECKAQERLKYVLRKQDSCIEEEITYIPGLNLGRGFKKRSNQNRS